MMRPFAVLVCAAALAAVIVGSAQQPRPALAAHHIAEISEVMFGFEGNPNIQYVEINQRDAFSQNFVQGTILTAFGPSGNFLGVMLTVPGNVNPGNNRKWIMGTTAFETASGIQADFEFPASTVVSPNSGMICWGGLGLSDQTNPNHYVDCIAYGSYTGPVVPTGPANANPAGDCQRSLTRVIPATGFNPPNPTAGTWADGNNSTDFAMASPSPENDAGTVGTLAGGLDTDSDTMADCRDPDDDNDGDLDGADNCPLMSNPGQEDADLDTAGDACDPAPAVPDFDGDNCLDGEELQTNINTGGRRDPTELYDFYDVTADRSIDLGDALKLLQHFGHTATQDAEDNFLDREIPVPAQNWRPAASDTGIDLLDVLANLQSFGHTCAGLPN